MPAAVIDDLDPNEHAAFDAGAMHHAAAPSRSLGQPIQPIHSSVSDKHTPSQSLNWLGVRCAAERTLLDHDEAIDRCPRAT